MESRARATARDHVRLARVAFVIATRWIGLVDLLPLAGSVLVLQPAPAPLIATSDGPST